MTCNYKKLDQKFVKIKDNISGYDKDVIIKTFRLPNGIIENFFIDKNKDSVQICALTDDGKAILVKQFRPGFEKETTELPGGGLEENENPKKCAERELMEETGYNGEIQFLGSVPYNPYSTGKRYNFVASNCRKIDRINPDENEFLKVVLYPMQKFESLIKTGKIRGHDCALMGLIKLGIL